jgi:type I restriction enzyme S subunit
LIPVLPLPEQTAIVDLLSTWDEAIEKTERLMKAKERRFKWLLRELISDLKSKQNDGGLKEVKLGTLFGKDIFVEKGKPLTKVSKTNGFIPVVAGGQSYAYFTSISTHKMSTITLSSSGAYAGFVWYHDYPIWASDCNVLYVKNGSTKFLYFILKTIQHRVYALQSGGAQPHVYTKDMKNLKIIWPSKDLQERIADNLTFLQNEIDILKQMVNKYKTQKRGLMQKMLTGEWRVIPEIVKSYEDVNL